MRTALALMALFFGGRGSIASTVNSLDFQMKDGESVLTISADGSIQTTQTAAGTEYQILLKDTKLSTFASRRLDTSSFEGSSVSEIVPSLVPGTNDARITVKLREGGIVPQLTSKDGKIAIFFPNTSTPESRQSGDANPNKEDASNAERKENGNKEFEREVQTVHAGPVDPASEPSRDPTAQAIDRALDAQKTQNFSGKPITVQVRDMDIKEALKLIGDASGFNIVVGDGVSGKVTLSLVDVPWDQVLDIVLRSQKLGADRKYNVLRVMPIAKLNEEKKEEQKTKALSKVSQPRITKIFPVSYADPNQLQNIAKQFLQSDVLEAQEAGVNVPPVIQVDVRTNSLIIQDFQDNVNKVTKLIELLDRQTPQVMIEARIVEAREQFTKNISGQLGLGGSGYMYSFNGGNPTADLATTTLNGATQGAFGLKPSVRFLPGNASLATFLKIQETQSNAKIVASPRVVVLNKESANIVQGIPILIPVTVTNGLNGVTQGVALDSVNISLNVKPQVTNDGSVIMDLQVQRDASQDLGNNNTGKSNRQIQTKVLVDSGATLVIGGIFTSDVSESESGFPYLRKIPILGWLFGTQGTQALRSELFIFVTPRILNTERSSFHNQG